MIRILVVRLSAIGDVIMASGLIPALRELHPEAHLAWLTDEAHADLLRHNPRLDRLHLWPRRRWRQLGQAGRYRELLREAGAFLRALRAERYDLVLDLQGLLKSAAFALLAGGRRIGLGSREGSRWLMSKVIEVPGKDRRIGGEYRELAAILGASPTAFALDIVVGAGDRARAAALLDGLPGTDYAVIAPFTTRPQKHWFDERWAELARRLRDTRGWPVLMLGGPGDRPRAAAIRGLSGEALIDLTGQTTLGLCAALIERAGLVIGVDTGLTHLGIAQGRPTLALFGSTRPYLQTGHPAATVLYQPLPCSPCRRRPSCGGSHDCMGLHTVDSVLAAAAQVLARP